MSDANAKQPWSDELTAEGLEHARRLVQSLEAGEMDEACGLLNRLCRMREDSLYQDIGRLARNLHRSINSFHHDECLHRLMTNEMPGARERLDSVIKTTEKYAHQTLNAIESCGPVVDGLAHLAAELQRRWQQLGDSTGAGEAVHAVVTETDAFLNAVVRDTEHIRGNMHEVLMAQSFQDITGQDIQRVINTVLEVEAGLLEMLQLGSTRRHDESLDAGSVHAGTRTPNVKHGDGELGQVDVDDLLASLGF